MTAATSAPALSGIAAVDHAWGGLRPSTSLLLVGRATAGRTALALQSVRAAVAAGQTALLLSPRSPDDLNAAAQSEGFDLAALHASGRLRVLRIPSAKDLAAKGKAGLEAAYRDLAGLAAKANADRVVIEDLTPLVQFPTFEAFGAAFGGLRNALGEAALVVGLGEPANAPSKRLIETVQGLVNGTVRVSGSDVSFEPTETAAPAEEQEPPAPAPPPTPEPAAPAPPPFQPAAFTPPPADPSPAFTSPPAPVSAPAPPMGSPTAPAFDPESESEPEPEPTPPAFDPAPSFTTPPAFDPEPTFDADPFFAASPASDGASVPVSEPQSPDDPDDDFDFAPPASAPVATDAAAYAPVAPAPVAMDGGIPRAQVEPAPPPDPELAAPTGDPFGRDPGASFFDNGYLVDSRGATATPISAAHSPENDLAAPVAPMPPPGVAPIAMPASPGMPGFTPVATPKNGSDDTAAIQAALQAAFAARAQGTPFLIVAARMEPSQPEAAHFRAVADGLRAATPPGGAFYADVARFRTLLLLPNAGQDAATNVFGALQRHLQGAIGPQAEGVLRAVAAITVPDGQPFSTPKELWDYAVAS